MKDFRTILREAIVRHHRTPFVKALHRMASFVETALRNEGSDFASNGERLVLERLQAAGFGVAVDVGANVGNWSLIALQLWPNCRVQAFEVAPETHATLEASSRASSHSQRLDVHNIGLSDQAGAQTMYYYPEHHGLTSDTRRHDSYHAVPFEAQLTTLDAFCRERGIRSIDYLKIDVEGAEHRVLQGASELLKAGGISCIQFEYGAFSIDTRFLLKDYYALLSDQFFIGKIHRTEVVFGDYDWRAEDFRFCNYLCISRTRPDLKRLVQA